jgi:OOP family OmpA-OmpF porin
MTDLRRITQRLIPLTSCLCLAALPLSALDLAWPDDAELVLQDPGAPGSHRIATGPFAEGALPTLRAEGTVSQQVWQIGGGAGDPLLMLEMVREQLVEQGFEIGFTCASRTCGGFDFRYGLPIAEGPAMYVDLGNYQYLAATRSTADGPDHIAVMLSHGGQFGYAHVAYVSPAGAVRVPVTPSTRLPETDDPPPADLIDLLLTQGHATLEDLTFETGASALSGTVYASLTALREFLSDNPARRIVLVGHTDAQGTLDANITLSRERATAVRQFLITEMGAPPDRVAAEGIGFLAPRASNATPEGREANRRVEVVLADPG